MSYDHLSDTELAILAASDTQAFGGLYDRYVRQIYAFVASRLNCCCEAEDVTSEVWMKVMDHLPRFKPKREQSLVAWLFAIARNAVTDAHRRRRPHESIDEEDAIQLESDEEHPGETMDRRTQFTALQVLIDTLPASQAQCLRLRFYGGLRNQEIAAAEGLSEKTVAAHISRGLQTLRESQIEELSSLARS